MQICKGHGEFEALTRKRLQIQVTLKKQIYNFERQTTGSAVWDSGFPYRSERRTLLLLANDNSFSLELR